MCGVGTLASPWRKGICSRNQDEGDASVSTPHPHHSRPYGTSVPFSLLLPDFLQVDVSRATLVESLYLILLLCLSISYSMIEVAQATFREEAEP